MLKKQNCNQSGNKIRLIMEADNIYANRYHDTTLRFQGFFKLIAVWKGSVMKLIWHDLGKTSLIRQSISSLTNQF